MIPSAAGNARWKVPYIKNYIDSELQKNHSIPFLLLTETWLKSYIADAQLHIPGYEVSRSDRDKKTGGGVLLYSHQSLPLSHSEKFDDDTCQVLLCRFDTIKLCMAIVYRPPKSPSSSFASVTKFLTHHVSLINDDSYEFCLAGDFNFPDVHWESQTILTGGTSEDQKSANMLLSFMSDQLLNQYVLIPTRKNNILDLFIFLTSNDRLVTSIASTPTNMSDHNIVDLLLSFNPISK